MDLSPVLSTGSGIVRPLGILDYVKRAAIVADATAVQTGKQSALIHTLSRTTETVLYGILICIQASSQALGSNGVAYGGTVLEATKASAQDRALQTLGSSAGGLIAEPQFSYFFIGPHASSNFAQKSPRLCFKHS